MLGIPHYVVTQRGRRALLKWLARRAAWAGVGMLGLAATLWSVAVGRFLTPNVTTGQPERFKAGSPDRYPPGCVEQRYREPFGTWIVRGEYDGQRQLYALSTVCTHLGCITLWHEGEQRFKCPCHGSAFGSNGVNVEGPAP
ncbi:MAG: Rieske 2Fe-2S domain-containing protein, partial [Patescibacteria group bacterium]|nr:Rieske 2Fe-2S domain-containing protein [Patescibacteria group bacterium]